MYTIMHIKCRIFQFDRIMQLQTPDGPSLGVWIASYIFSAEYIRAQTESNEVTLTALERPKSTREEEMYVVVEHYK